VVAPASRSLLIVVHALPPAEVSGTPLVAYGYAQAFGKAGWRVTVMSATPGAPPWEQAQASRDSSGLFDRLVVPPDYGAGSSWLDAWSVPTAATCDDSEIGARVARVLERLDPDVVHIVDNVFLPLCIAEIAHGNDIPVVRGVSDAEDLCALVVPVSPCSGPSGYCESPLTVNHCAGCVTNATTDHLLEPFRRTGDWSIDTERRARLRQLIGAQRARAAHLFSSVYDRVVFASDQFRTYFERTLPLDPCRTCVVPMGVEVVSAETDGRRGVGNRLAKTRQHNTAAPAALTFLVAGNTNPFKGTGAIVSAFTHRALGGRHDWRLLLAGGGNRQLYGHLLDDPRVHDHGPYDLHQLLELVALADIGVSASIFETFHRVTREYLAGGLPVVGSMAFGISDVVVDGWNGLLFDHCDEGGLRETLVRILDDRALLDRLRVGAAATKVRSVDEEVSKLALLYDEVILERSASS
jgi:glycosyltransferase involved in cell wall biosynthesis